MFYINTLIKNNILHFGIIFLIFMQGVLPANEKSETLKPGVIKGWVYDTLANEPLEFATVTLKNKEDGSLVTGAITDVNGFFRLTEVDEGDYFLELSFLGYKEKTFENIEISLGQPSMDLGKMLLSPTDEMLNEVVVSADRPTMTYQIDKKVINVSQLHTSASGTAVEVLENIPSVTVSIEGEVSLRGSSSFTVLIDGKPSILDANDILNQIPASQIENIEIITNPSAKFNPDGVAGIINIVMKKNRQDGVNGIVNLNGGTQNRMGGDFLVNYRKERINYFLGGDYNQRGMTGNSVRNSETILDQTNYLYSDGIFNRDRNSYGARAGMEFNINPLNTLSLSYRFNYGEFGSSSDRDYEEWTSADLEKFLYASFEDNVRGGFSHSFNVDYKKDFDKEEHSLLARAVFQTRNSEDISENMLSNSDLVDVSGQKSIEAGPSSRLSFNLDYTLPLLETNKLEAGWESRVRLANETNELFQYDTQANDYFLDDFYSKDVDYNRDVHAAYSTFSGEWSKLGYQLGLRTEYTQRLIDLRGETNEFTMNRWDFYPTVHFSYKLPAEQQFMTSYTRRLQRLRGWYLEPFYTWSDAFNIRIGNPNLDPEYIDSYEMSYQKRFEKNILSVDLYYRVTHNKIERVRSVFNPEENILLTSFANVGKDYSLGTEIMTGFDPAKWWHFDLMGNLYDYRLTGSIDGEDFSTSSFNWNVRWNNDFRLSSSSRIQFRAMYNSPTVMAQGERSEFFVTSLAVKQDFLEKALSLTLQVRDIFSTMRGEYTYSDDNFYSFSSWDAQTPIITLTASYRINNYNNQRGGRGPNGNGGMDNMGGDM
ncbi:MAG: TonB-dependent receptor domain-containing protein [Bacteroidales bacterium]